MQNRTAISLANLESNTCNAPLGAKKTKGQDSRISIVVHSIRKRLIDVDGASVKAVLDGLVKAGILVDDKAEIIEEITYTQEKGKEEKTIISLYQ